MKSAWLVAVVVCVVLTSAAFAQFSPRSMGMGSTGVGVADDGAAWYQNPAGLGALNLAAQEDKMWANDVIGGFADMGSDTAWGATWSGWQPAKAMGFGAGFGDVENSGTTLGGGFGMAIKNSALSLGVNVVSFDRDDYSYSMPVSKSPGSSGTTTTFDLGALYKFAQPEKAPISVGLVVRDITDEDQTHFDVGVAWPATDKLLIAVDVLDIADDFGYGAMFNAGAEMKFGEMNEWTARIGEVDDGDNNNLTLGAGYAFANNWRLDAAWVDSDHDSSWSVAAGFGF